MSRTLKTENRPFGWRALVLGYGLLALRSWGRIWYTLDDLDGYQSLQKAPPLVTYLAFNAAVGIVTTLILVGLWRRLQSLPPMLVPITVCVAVGDLVWLASFSGTADVRQNIPFLGVVWMGIAIWIGLIRRRKAFQYYFQRYAKES